MTIKKKDLSFEARPGQLYKGITDVGEKFEGETKPTIEQDNSFVALCKKMRSYFPAFAANAVFSEQHRDAVDFLGWRLSAGDFMAALKGTAVLGFIPGIIIIALLFLFGIGITINDFSTNEIIPGAGFCLHH